MIDNPGNRKPIIRIIIANRNKRENHTRPDTRNPASLFYEEEGEKHSTLYSLIPTCVETRVIYSAKKQTIIASQILNIINK